MSVLVPYSDSVELVAVGRVYGVLFYSCLVCPLPALSGLGVDYGVRAHELA